MRNYPLPCQCTSGVEVIHANDVDGVTEYMCRGCGDFYPVLQPGESWEPWENETANAYTKRCGSYHGRISPLNESTDTDEASEPWRDSWE